MKGKNWGLGAFCYLAVFAMALLALPALLWFCRRGAGEEDRLRRPASRWSEFLRS